MESILQEMKDRGIIEESSGPLVSSVVLVKKKDRTLRFFVDYWKLNAVTIKDSYPLSRIDNLLDQLSSNKWFLTLDIKSGYWQSKIHPEDRAKTAFSVGSGLWQFTVMPFGLCNAPATFERLIEQFLQQHLFKICLVYLDDVIVFGESFEKIMANLEVFLKLRTANLKLNLKKCNFFGRQVRYLCHVISAQGISTDPENIAAVSEWPVPQNKK